MPYFKLQSTLRACQPRLLFGLATTVLLAPALVAIALLHAGPAQACSATPNPSLGTDTQTVTIPTAGTYYLWSRVLVPDTTNNSYYLQVDGGCAIDVGDSASIPANTWTWVNYQDGSTSSVTSMSLTAGPHSVVMTGNGIGVGVDRVLFLGSSSCVPTGTGDNCTPAPDTTPPTVSMSAPTSGATVSGTTTVSATASDNVAVQSVQFQLDGANLGSADTASPYTYSWDTTTASNGSHTLTAIATDTSGNTTTSSPVTVTVNNSSGGGTPGDINGDGTVNIVDLSLLLSHYGTNYAPAEFDHAATVDIEDLSILLANYGK